MFFVCLFVCFFIAQPLGQYLGRTVRVEEGRLNVFILLDTSGSILQENFDKAKTAITELVRKVCICKTLKFPSQELDTNALSSYILGMIVAVTGILY